MRYAHEHSLAETAGRVKVVLSTNGTLIDEPTAAALVEMGTIVQISLDGASAATHDAVRRVPGEAAEDGLAGSAFARTWAGIRHLQRHGVGDLLAINVTLMRHNVDEAAAIVALAAEEGVPAVRFVPVQAMGRGADNWENLAPDAKAYEAAYNYLYHGAHPPGVVVSQGLPGLELEPPAGRSWCGLGRLLLVDSRGNLYPCSLLTEPEFRLGHVNDVSLVEALASPKLHDLARMCDRRRNEIEACAACAWRHFCQGSCPGGIWLEHGTWHAVEQLLRPAPGALPGANPGTGDEARLVVWGPVIDFPLPFFSVVVPTYRRPGQLAACLGALSRLDYPRDRFEVIVVNDGSPAPPQGEVEGFRDRLDVQLLRQAHAGPAAARNAGVTRARGHSWLLRTTTARPLPAGFRPLPAVWRGARPRRRRAHPERPARQRLLDREPAHPRRGIRPSQRRPGRRPISGLEQPGCAGRRLSRGGWI